MTHQEHSQYNDHRFELVLSFGFGCLLTTLLIYTVAVTPFQRFDNAPEFAGQLTHVALRCSLLLSLLVVVCLIALRSRGSMPQLLAIAQSGYHANRLIALVGAITYLLGCFGFCAVALQLLPATIAEIPVGVLMGLGCVIELLTWGRLMSAYRLTQATAVTCIAVVIAVAMGLLLEVVPVAAIVPIFCLYALIASLMPVVVGVFASSNTANLSNESNIHPSIRDFISIIAIPAIGLILFAMIMAARADQFAGDFSLYCVTQLIVVALLLIVVLVKRCQPLVSMAYRSLIPILAVVAVGCCEISQVIWGGSPFELFFVFLLYSAAAILTVATLIGIMHAAEFSSDLVVGLAIALFCGATLAAGRIMRGFEQPDIRAFVCCITAVYAMGMTIYSLIRGEHARQTRDNGLDSTFSNVPNVLNELTNSNDARMINAIEIDDNVKPDMTKPPSLETRCSNVAQAYGLTPREGEVLQILAQGHNAVYVSETLLISPNTARTHVHNIYRKLNISSREELLALVSSQ